MKVTDELFWSDDLITGEKIVDFQHKVIFNYLNFLILSAKSKETQQVVLKNALNALVEYTVIHFEDEEMVLESIGYPDLAKHRKIHHDCAKHILDFKQRFEAGEDMIDELILFIKNWIVEHIKQEDMRALKFKKENQQSPL